MIKYIFLFLVPLITISCASSEEFSGFSYDPPDVTNTADKEIDPQKKRIIGAGEPKVWVSNEFEGARLSDFYMASDSVLEVFIKPENAPINNSPWYAFKIWSDASQTVKIRLNYEDASHRYIPKINHKKDGKWEVTGEAEFTRHTDNDTALLNLELDQEPILISGQPLFTSSDFADELEDRNITTKNFVKKKVAGKSKKGRPIWELDITEAKPDATTPVLVIISRQHPPEVSGFRSSLIFLEEITSDTDLAGTFREIFLIKAFPMLNPDGVDNGHWRHNAGGIDLNRDWENFNQPETRTIRDALLPLKEMPNRPVFYGIDFHSTNENIFYPIAEEVVTTPDNFTQKWTEKIKQENPSVQFVTEEFDTSAPISKNWLFKTFGADAITFEIDDELDSETLEQISRSACRIMMKMLIEEWQKKNP